MATNKIILLLFLGGFIGWTLFVLTIVHSICIQRTQLLMVDDISKEFKKVREELRELK